MTLQTTRIWNKTSTVCHKRYFTNVIYRAKIVCRNCNKTARLLGGKNYSFIVAYRWWIFKEVVIILRYQTWSSLNQIMCGYSSSRYNMSKLRYLAHIIYYFFPLQVPMFNLPNVVKHINKTPFNDQPNSYFYISQSKPVPLKPMKVNIGCFYLFLYYSYFTPKLMFKI